MNSVLSDFQTRSREVECYFSFVLRLAKQEISLHPGEGNEGYTAHENEELLKTLKAACYLLLYNLVESTMRNAVEAIFVELQTKQTSFDHCREELRLEILTNLKKRSPDKLLPKLLSLAVDVVHETFERSEAFSGNLDARTIRKTAQRFGFAEPVGGKFGLLQTVKDLRNDLAHGVKSFAEVGRNASPSDLELARQQAEGILTETLTNIQRYLVEQHYLAGVRQPDGLAH
jgi:hypothetical protein